MKCSSLLKTACAAAGCLFAAGVHPLAAQTNLLTNGSFENPGSTQTSTYSSVVSGANKTSSTITGWTATTGSSGSASVIYNASGTTGATWSPNPDAGTYTIQMDSSSASNDTAFTTGDSMAQSLTLGAGSYQLTFYYQSEVGSGKGGDVALQLSLAGIGAITGVTGTGPIQFDHNFTSAPAKAAASPVLTTVQTPAKNTDTLASETAAMGWQPVQVNFTMATAGTVTVKLSDVATTTFANYSQSSNVSIDNVVLSSVPEPSAMVWLAVAAVGGLAAAGRGLTRKTAWGLFRLGR